MSVYICTIKVSGSMMSQQTGQNTLILEREEKKVRAAEFIPDARNMTIMELAYNVH